MARVLIVDSDAPDRADFAGILRQLGHQVDFAASPDEAVTVLRETPHDLVVGNLRLAPQRWLDVRRLLQQDEQLQRLPKSLLRVVAGGTSSEVTRPSSDSPARQTAPPLAQDILFGRVAAPVIHDVHQPLGAIKNLAWVGQRLIADLEGEAADRLFECHEQISAATSEASERLRILGDFCRGRNETSFRLDDVARTIASLLHRQAEQAGISIAVELPDEPCDAVGDAVDCRWLLVARVLESLIALENPAHAGRAIGAARVEVSVIADDRHFELTVNDNRFETRGSGETQQRDSLEQKALRQFGREMVSRLMGRIKVDGVTEVGGIFAVELPRTGVTEDA